MSHLFPFEQCDIRFTSKIFLLAYDKHYNARKYIDPHKHIFHYIFSDGYYSITKSYFTSHIMKYGEYTYALISDIDGIE